MIGLFNNFFIYSINIYRMSKNLQGYSGATNSDWGLWLKLVKKAYKSQGHDLTQQQLMIVAKESYPGKGNVIGKNENKLKIPVNDDIPANPVRRKKEPAPKKKPEVYRRDEERSNYNTKKRRDYDDESPEPRRRRREDDDQPRRRRRDDYSPEPRRERRRSPSPKPKRNLKKEKASKPRRRYSEEEDSDSEDYRSPRRRRKY